MTMRDMALLDEAAVETRGRWKPYLEYVDSGVDWLGAMPAHWRPTPTKRLLRVVSGATPSTANEHFWGGDIAWLTPDDLGSSTSRTISNSSRRITAEGLASCGACLVPRGSLVLSTRAPIGHVAIADAAVCTNQGCRALVPFGESVSSPFYYYVYVAAKADLQSLGAGSTFMELAKSKLEDFPVPVPRVEEQQAIVTFLDRETARFEALIEMKERLIDLLTEHRSAVIDDAVGMGSPQRLMALTAHGRPIMYGIVLPGPNVLQGVPIIKGGDVDHGRLHPKLLSRTTFEIDSSHARSRVRAGDIVYAIRGSIGAAAVVPDSLDGANITQDAARISPREGVDRRWLHYALSSTVVFAQLEAGSVGATIRGINIRDLKRAVVQVPSPDEQRRIADELDQETARIDALVSKVRDHIALLREYRAALISAAVTGKIDVRDEVAA